MFTMGCFTKKIYTTDTDNGLDHNIVSMLHALLCYTDIVVRICLNEDLGDKSRASFNDFRYDIVDIIERYISYIPEYAHSMHPRGLP